MNVKVYDICGEDYIVCEELTGEVLAEYIKQTGVELDELYWTEQDINASGMYCIPDTLENNPIINFLHEQGKDEFIFTDDNGRKMFGSLLKYDGIWQIYQPYSEFIKMYREDIEDTLTREKFYWAWSNNW